MWQRASESGADCVLFAGITQNHAAQVVNDVAAGNSAVTFFGGDGVVESAFARALEPKVAARTFLTLYALPPRASDEPAAISSLASRNATGGSPARMRRGFARTSRAGCPAWSMTCSRALRIAEVPTAPRRAGHHLYSEGPRHLYVGRTRDLARRWGDHTQPAKGINSASFAFNIAKRDAAEAGADVSCARETLASDPMFAAAFIAAKQRARMMDYRFVRVDSPLLSTVGEVYAAVVLGTEGDFNAFETH